MDHILNHHRCSPAATRPDGKEIGRSGVHALLEFHPNGKGSKVKIPSNGSLRSLSSSCSSSSLSFPSNREASSYHHHSRRFRCHVGLLSLFLEEEENPFQNLIDDDACSAYRTPLSKAWPATTSASSSSSSILVEVVCFVDCLN